MVADYPIASAETLFHMGQGRLEPVCSALTQSSNPTALSEVRREHGAVPPPLDATLKAKADLEGGRHNRHT